MVPVGGHSHCLYLFDNRALFITIVMLWIASTFHSGKGGSNRTSSFCNTPRLNVQIAYCAAKLVPSVSVTETAESEYSIFATVAWRRTCDDLRNPAASA